MEIQSLEKLKQDLSALGIRTGDVVLMHSSYKSLGGVENGAQEFFATFLDLLGPEGTLIVPVLSYRTVNVAQPVFDRNNTPSCVGYLSEYFRTQVPGVVRSMHPTHSCCLYGKLAQQMAEGHELDDTPVGPHSPFARLPLFNGKILMLGCGTACNTSMHGVEETAQPPYLFSDNMRVDYILHDGDRVIHQHAYRHFFGEGNVDHVYAQRYSRLIPLLTDEEAKQGKVLCADSYLLSAKAVWEKGHNKLLEDPCYFVEHM